MEAVLPGGEAASTRTGGIGLLGQGGDLGLLVGLGLPLEGCEVAHDRFRHDDRIVYMQIFCK